MSNLNPVRARLLGRLTALAALTVACAFAGTANAATGEENYAKICAACHSIGGGKLVGPDLAGVTTRRTEEWLVKFIKSPKAMIDAGDATAIALFKEFNLVMPDPQYTEAEIKDIVAYLATKSGAAAVAPTPPPPPKEASPAEIARGQNLFQGLERLKNNGPACNSCHHVKNDAVIGGGVLAKDLTAVFTRLGTPGINAILGTPPFPVMAAAYAEHPLADDETAAIVGFLQDADRKQELQKPADYGMKLVTYGAGGLVPLFALYSLVWRKRKVGPVNAKVFDRQVKGGDDIAQ
ncbi:MAG: c-type cytochrome [Deltaproteobacteria bacterium]|nr:c-type cytochrome [Deltaproteobacteria bacterium]